MQIRRFETICGKLIVNIYLFALFRTLDEAALDAEEVERGTDDDVDVSAPNRHGDKAVVGHGGILRLGVDLEQWVAVDFEELACYKEIQMLTPKIYKGAKGDMSLAAALVLFTEALAYSGSGGRRVISPPFEIPENTAIVLIV